MEKLPNLVRRWYVYKTTNPENQVYIGRTSNIKNRKSAQLKPYWHRHKINRRNRFFIESLKTHEVENHKFEVIESFDGTEREVDSKEMFWIRTYMSNRNKYPEQNGFNLTDGGIGIRGYKNTEETKQKMSISGANKIFTETHKNNISKGRMKPILQYDLKGNFIREYPSIQSASIGLWGKTNKGGGCISAICKGKKESYKNFTFKYK